MSSIHSCREIGGGFCGSTNQIVDAEVSHTPDLVKDRKLKVIDRSFHVEEDIHMHQSPANIPPHVSQTANSINSIFN